MNLKIIDNLVVVIDNIVPARYLSKFQEFLLSGAIFTDASKVLAILVIFLLLSETALASSLMFINLPLSVLIIPLFSIPGLFTYVIVQQERRAQEIERTAPDFLRQLSSMLQVGLSFEKTYFSVLTRTVDGALYSVWRTSKVRLSFRGEEK